MLHPTYLVDAPRQTALFVDLDGTLVATDVLWEAFMRVVKAQPWVVFIMPLWLLRGRAALKREMSERAAVEAASLPYRDEVVEYIKERRGNGCRVVLATASDRRWADGVAAHLEIFDDVIASDGERNLKGAHKLAAIETYCAEHQLVAWGYVGDASADVPIWTKADEVLMVEPSAGLLSRVRASKEPARVFGKRKGKLRAIAKAMRVHQWVKQVLLFVPLLLARRFDDIGLLVDAAAAFVAFSLCASAVYVGNDLFDIEADRHHPRKRKRPFAAGTLPIMFGPPMLVGLLLAAFTISALVLPPVYMALLVLYLIVNGLYSSVLKSKLLVDVMVLAGLYTLRIYAGGVATQLVVSEWLLAFSIFMFTSLAFAKRYVEMARLSREGATTAKGRGYEVGDLSLIESIGPTSGYLAVLVFALYIHDGAPEVYANKSLLWLTCPLLLYWITRLWFLAKRAELHDDPVVFAVTDKVSLGVGATVGALVLLAGLPIW
jgi:4-hydroxybenzoate polyprenyltransferase/phosphoserine phosphatase